MKKLILHETQIEAINACNKSLKKGKNKMALIMATASGKTIVAISLIEKYLKAHRSAKVLFVSHLEEIWSHTKKTFDKYLPEDMSSVYAGADRNADTSIVLASVRSLYNDIFNKKPLFKKDEFDFIVVDEFHHSGADTWEAILKYFKPQILLGMSCLKERNDDREFLHYFGNNIIYELDTVTAIEKKAIAPLKYYAVNTIPETPYPLHINGKVYEEHDQNRSLTIKGKNAKIVETHFVKHTKKLVDEYIKLAVGKKAIVFCTTIKHATKTTKIFNQKGIKAVAIHSTREGIKGSSSEEMKEKTEDFRADKYMVACTIDKWLEGADFPDVEVGMFMRPTASWSVWCQSRGRILRKSPNKKFGIILDCVGSYKYIKIYRNLKIEHNIWLSNRLHKTVPEGMADWSTNALIDLNRELKEVYREMALEGSLGGMLEGTKHKDSVIYDMGDFEIVTDEIDDIFYRTGEAEPTHEVIKKAWDGYKEKCENKKQKPSATGFCRYYGHDSNKLINSIVSKNR